jgi:hypothetical protein
LILKYLPLSIIKEEEEEEEEEEEARGQVEDENHFILN